MVKSAMILTNVQLQMTVTLQQYVKTMLVPMNVHVIATVMRVQVTGFLVSMLAPVVSMIVTQVQAVLLPQTLLLALVLLVTLVMENRVCPKTNVLML